MGLKPLTVGDQKATPKEPEAGATPDQVKKAANTYIDQDTNTEFEHVPAKNLAAIAEQKKFKQRLDEQREKRRQLERLKEVKGLGDESDDDSSANAWLAKLKEREEATKKARLLAEMDEEFVKDDEDAPPTQVVAAAAKKSATTTTTTAANNYTEASLRGLRVEHDTREFKEGHEIILTLKDANILSSKGDTLNDEDDDVLINVNIADDERATKNNEAKKSKPVYKPYDDYDDEANGGGEFKPPRDILDKYDEELNGGGANKSKKSFVLGARGTYDASDERMLEQLNREHRARAIKMDALAELRTATDYMTPQEAAAEKFKKSKKSSSSKSSSSKKMLRGGGSKKSKQLKADDLLPLAADAGGSGVASSAQAARVKREQGGGGGGGRTVSLKNIDFGFEKEDGEQDDDDDDDNDDGQRKSDDDDDDDEDAEFNLDKLREAEMAREILEEESNALDELHAVLSKTRKRLIAEPVSATLAAAAAADQIKLESEETSGGANNRVAFDALNTLHDESTAAAAAAAANTSLTLDTMSEFCRNLAYNTTSNSRGEDLYGGDQAAASDADDDDHDKEPVTSKANGEKHDEEEEEEEDMDMEADVGRSSASSDMDEDEEGEVKKPKAVSAAVATTTATATESMTESGIMEDEPTIDRGLAACLKLAVSKGFLVQEKEKKAAAAAAAGSTLIAGTSGKGSSKRAEIEAAHITIEEKSYYDIDDKYNRQRDRFSGPLNDFEEKTGYKPDFKLDYHDEKGHAMNPKEAFRYLSHRFHGKGSGKKKTEKRVKKIQELETMNKMSSVDTPLNTVALLADKQKRLQQPYVVLSTQKGTQNQ